MSELPVFLPRSTSASGLPIDHVVFLVRSIERSSELLAALDIPSYLDIEIFEKEGTRERYIDIKQEGEQLSADSSTCILPRLARILLQECLSGSTGPYSRAFDKRGPGLHHIAVVAPSRSVLLQDEKSDSHSLPSSSSIVPKWDLRDFKALPHACSSRKCDATKHPEMSSPVVSSLQPIISRLQLRYWKSPGPQPELFHPDWLHAGERDTIWIGDIAVFDEQGKNLSAVNSGPRKREYSEEQKKSINYIAPFSILPECGIH